MIINARGPWNWRKNPSALSFLLKSAQARPLCLCECSFLERDEELISLRLPISPSCWRRLAVLSGCNGDVGESGSGRFVLPVPGALAPSEVETRSSPVFGSTDGGFRGGTMSESPNGLADRSGRLRSVLCKSGIWSVAGSLRAGSSWLSFGRSCLPIRDHARRYAAPSSSPDGPTTGGPSG